MTASHLDPGPRSSYPRLQRLSISEDWFEIYRIARNLFALHEPRHYEQTNTSLLIGRQKAVLVDTGCGIGDLRRAVEQLTDRPIMVVNTHTHPDHIGSNHQFDEITMFDHPVTRRVAAQGVSQQILQAEITAENLVTPPWPRDFDSDGFELPPIEVDRWLNSGDRIDLGGRDLEVIPTPGEAADHICLLDRADRVLFCGDILLRGPVWTHLEGGSLQDLIESYRRLMHYFDDFDHLMPSHNDPWIDKTLLPEALAGAEKIAAGEVRPEEYIDPWNRRLWRYSVGRFELLMGSRQEDGRIQ